MQNIDIVNKICENYGVQPETIAKKKHGSIPELSYKDIILRLITLPTTGLEHSFPEMGRTSTTSHLRKIFPNKPNNRELWGVWLLATINMKKCTQCGHIKEFSMFPNYTNSTTGLRNICKECHMLNNNVWNANNPLYHSEYSKEHYNLHKEDYKERSKRYYLDHKEVINIKSKAYWQENKPRLAEISREHYLNNILYYKEYRKKYYLEHKAQYADYDAKRRAIEIKAQPSWASLAEIKKIYLGRREGEHVDHIIPLQGELVCGLHCEHNLQYLPIKDNLSKGNTFNIDTYTHSTKYKAPYDR